MTFAAISGQIVFADITNMPNKIMNILATLFGLLSKHFVWKDSSQLKVARNIPYTLLPRKPVLKVTFLELFLLKSWEKKES